MQYIPSDVMPHIVSYLDMKDCAKMAMVSKTWNHCMYRNNVWGNDRWNPQPGTIGTVLLLQKYAKHIGSPYKACFFNWLDSQRITLSEPLSHYYRYWKQIGLPCLYLQHHRFEDTLIAKNTYKRLSAPDQLYIFHRFARYEIHEHTNRYSLLLQSLLREFKYIQMHLTMGSSTAAAVATGAAPSDDLCTVFYTESSRILHTHQEELNTYLRQYIHRLKGCIQALESRGNAIWIQNEAAFARNPLSVWESVAFSLE